jgi:hypothetical protein
VVVFLLAINQAFDGLFLLLGDLLADPFAFCAKTKSHSSGGTSLYI